MAKLGPLQVGGSHLIEIDSENPIKIDIMFCGLIFYDVLLIVKSEQ